MTTTEIVAQPKTTQFDLSPQTFDQALTFANYLADSDLVPKDFKGRPGNCLIAMQWGNELGLKPLQALQNLAVINGRPALWGDAVIALVRSSPSCEYIVEDDNGDTATCRVKRRGEPEQARTFSMADAKAAGLAGKQGPWTQYPKRMRQMRARAFALRDVFPDVLRGLPVAEEVMDIPAESKPINPATGEIKPVASIELIDKARVAADAGRDNFAAWWKACTPDERASLRDQMADLKARTEKSDAVRTVDAPEPAKPPKAPKAEPAAAPSGKTFDEVMTMLCSAANLDALYVASDWVGEIADPEQRAILSAKFDELQQAFGG